MKSTILSIILIALVAYYFAYMNLNDFILMPWSITWVVCRYGRLNCFNTLERLAKFAEDNIDWELEKRTYYHMEKNGIYQLEEIPASEYTYQKLDKLTKGFTIPVVVRGEQI
jgi:hypothetical protein